MQVQRFIVMAALLLTLLSHGWAAQTSARARIVQNQTQDRRARLLRKLPGRRGANQRQASGVSPKFFDQLLKMPASERQQFLRRHPRFQHLPAREREAIQQRLRRLSQMPPSQRDGALERYRLFDRLPRERQSEARAIFQRWQRLPQERRSVLLDEYDGLRESPLDAREDRFSSKEFTDEFSDEERRILMDLSGLLPGRPGPGQP
ncbi:MAG: DUF3106 domain-containing protein [Acidobacteria bacterium]|nr:DUF3106 domain-containing protein [Acidobacteriota bacterium]